MVTRLRPKTNLQTTLTCLLFEQSLSSLHCTIPELPCVKTDGQTNLISPMAGLKIKKLHVLLICEATNKKIEIRIT
jgi:hypothetical protein